MSRKLKIKRAYKRQKKEEVISHEFHLTPDDRLTYVYKRDTIKNITEVVNVSFEILIEDCWVTIIHYDSYHGYLHVHNRIDLNDEKEIVTTINLPGSHDSWLKWAIKDIKDNYLEYKNTFLQRL